MPGCEGPSTQSTHFQAGQRCTWMSSLKQQAVVYCSECIGGGLACLDMRDPPHTRSISRRAKGGAHLLVQQEGVGVPGCEGLQG